MGPGFVRRDVRWACRCLTSLFGGFNGARLRSPGCASPPPPAVGPVWRGFNGARLRSPGCAWPTSSRACRITPCFNGARLRSPGCAKGWSSTRSSRPKSFNGARLRSPGCALPAGCLIPMDVAASMGPGFVRRDVPRARGEPRPGLHASMGPGFVRRDVPHAADRRPGAVAVLQWGPASFAGMCPRSSPRPAAAPGCFNGARLRSPGCARASAARTGRRGALLQWGPASFAGMCRRIARSAPSR